MFSKNRTAFKSEKDVVIAKIDAGKNFLTPSFCFFFSIIYLTFCFVFKQLNLSFSFLNKQSNLSFFFFFFHNKSIDAHKEIGGAFDVRGFPTIKYFAKGTPAQGNKGEDYNQGRTADDLVSFMNQKSGARARIKKTPSSGKRKRGKEKIEK